MAGKIQFDDNKKKKGSKKIVKIILFLIICSGLAYLGSFLFQKGIITKDNISGIIDIYSKTAKIYGSYLLAIIILLIGIILFLSSKIAKFPFKITALQANLKLKEKEMGRNLSKFRDQFNEKSFRFSTLIMKVSELISSLDKDKIFNTMLTSIEKGTDATELSIWLLNHKKNELVPIKSLGIDIAELKMFNIKLSDENFIASAANNMGFYSKQDAAENVHSKGLIDKTPFNCVIAFPIICQGKVFGVVNIGNFNSSKYSIGNDVELTKKNNNKDEEENKNYFEYTKDDKILMITLARLCGLALVNSNVLSMTEDELVSEKKFSAKQLEEKKAVKDMFSKYSAPAVVEQLLVNPGMLKLGGETKHITVFFSDIRNFTTYSEKYPPHKVVEVLNEYLSAMTQVVMDYKGTLDKFIGDAVMAIWGAPLSQEDHAILAVKASWKMLLVLKELQAKWRKNGLEPFGIGIGVNTGDMIVGNIGSEQRMDYTVIGDAVNACSRLEGLTRKFPTDMIISDSTYKYVKDIVDAKKLGAVQVKGKKDTVTIYQINDVREYDKI